MASLSAIPLELTLTILEFLRPCGDWAALARIDRRHYDVVNPRLYRWSASTVSKRALFWGAAAGQLGTVMQSIEAGIDPNWLWRSVDPRPEFWGLRPVRAATETARVGGVAAHRRTFGAYGVDRLAALMDYDASRTYHWNALHIAAAEGHDDIVAALLDHGARSAMSNWQCACPMPRLLRQNRRLGRAPGPHRSPADDNWTPLHMAICKGHESTAKILVPRALVPYVDAGVGTARHLTPLHAACQQGMLSLLKLIVERGHQGDLNREDKAGQTPLVYAFICRHWDCFEYLLDRGANINHPTRLNEAGSMLADACALGDYDAACRLLDMGIEINIATYEGVTEDPLTMVLAQPWDVNPGALKFPADRGMYLVETLIRRGADIEWRNPGILDATPLMLAAGNAKTTAVRELVTVGARIDAQDGMFCTALHYACDGALPSTCAETVEYLLECGAEVDMTNSDNQTPLHLACGADPSPYKTDVVKLLLKYGADPQRRFIQLHAYYSRSPLGEALATRDLAVCRLLLGKLNELHIMHDEFMALFQIFRTNQDVSCLELILDLYEECYVRDPIFLLSLASPPACPPKGVQLLLKRGASYTYQPESGNAAIICALKSGLDDGVIQDLLENGSDPNTLTWKGESPLTLALQGKSYTLSTLTMLLDHGARVHLQLKIPPSAVGFPQDKFRTPLTLATLRRDQYRAAFDLMIAREPFRSEHSEDQLRLSVQAAVRNLNRHAFGAILDSCPPAERGRMLDKYATRFLEVLLDALAACWCDQPRADDPLDVAALDGAVAIMACLNDHGADWAHRPHMQPRGLPAFDRLRALVYPPEPPPTQLPTERFTCAGMAWYLRGRVTWDEGGRGDSSSSRWGGQGAGGQQQQHHLVPPLIDILDMPVAALTRRRSGQTIEDLGAEVDADLWDPAAADKLRNLRLRG